MRLRQRGRSLYVFAPAKINLFLEILGRRADGFHELETLMVSVGVYDTLSITEGQTGETRLRVFDAYEPYSSAAVRDAPLSAGTENLVVKAAVLLRSHVKTDRGVRIDLAKRIPVAAGMAGGSSDAAATLAGLNRYWDLHLSRDELMRLAGRLGSDVGFFLTGAPVAVCRGRGEIVEPVDLPLNAWFVIVKPQSGLSTPDVFRHCRPADRPKSVGELLSSLREGRWERIAGALHNALQSAAEALEPDVTKLKEEFSTEPVMGHMMTGSGTAYFGICATRRAAVAVAARLRRTPSGRVFVARSGP